MRMMRVSGTPPNPAASFHVWIGCVRLGDRFNYYPPCRETRLGSPQYWGVSAIRDSFHIVIHASCHQVFIQYQINYENHGTILLEAICHNCTRLPVIWVFLFGSDRRQRQTSRTTGSGHLSRNRKKNLPRS